MRKSILLVVALALFAGLIAGCGGGGDSATATNTSASSASAPSSKAEFIKAADKVCEKAKEVRFKEAVKYRKVHRKELAALKPVPSEEKIIRAVTLPSIAKQAEEMEAVGIPEGQEKKLEAIFASLQKGLKGAEKDPYAIELENPSENPFQEVDLLLFDYGFVGCKNVP